METLAGKRGFVKGPPRAAILILPLREAQRTKTITVKFHHEGATETQFPQAPK
jgi:hypothetical protein